MTIAINPLRKIPTGEIIEFSAAMASCVTLPIIYGSPLFAGIINGSNAATGNHLGFFASSTLNENLPYITQALPAAATSLVRIANGWDEGTSKTRKTLETLGFATAGALFGAGLYWAGFGLGYSLGMSNK